MARTRRLIKYWTTREIRDVIELRKQGMAVKLIAIRKQRSAASVWNKLLEHNARHPTRKPHVKVIYPTPKDRHTWNTSGTSTQLEDQMENSENGTNTK